MASRGSGRRQAQGQRSRGDRRDRRGNDDSSEDDRPSRGTRARDDRDARNPDARDVRPRGSSEPVGAPSTVRLLDPAEAALTRLQDRVITLEVALLRCINLCNKATHTLSGAMVPVSPTMPPAPTTMIPPTFAAPASGHPTMPPPAPPPPAPATTSIIVADDEEMCRTPDCGNQRPVSHGGYCRECRRNWHKEQEAKKRTHS